MKKAVAILGSVIFLVIAPGTVAGLVPWWINHWTLHAPFFGVAAVRIVGLMVLTVGAVVLLDCFARFALQGLGTPAPVAPTEHLVVTGWYRFVRNPMYVAVTAAVLGQALFFGDVRLLEYAAAVWVAFHCFVLLYEEPTLRRTFPGDYAKFCANVPRWIPRLRAWSASE